MFEEKALTINPGVGLSEKSSALLARMQQLAASDNGRGVDRLSSQIPDSLSRAISSVLQLTPTTALLITGFTIIHADPPAAETDGPLGTVLISRVLEQLGWQVKILTDQHSLPVIDAAISAGGSHASSGSIQAFVEKGAVDSELRIFVERVGPGVDGSCRNMRGVVVDTFTESSHGLLSGFDGVSIGIGDGGNEVGMANFGIKNVAAHMASPPECVCVVSTTHALVSGTSNWGAYAFALGLAGVASDWQALDRVDFLGESYSRNILNAMIEQGAVDGMTAETVARIDGLDWSTYWDVCSQILRLAVPSTLQGE